MIEYLKERCTGCSACKNICPNESILMQYDNEGFVYPQVNLNTCIDCGLCQKACPLTNNPEDNNMIKKAYAIKTKDEDVRLNSSSGGVFSEIAKEVFLAKGVVFGATFNNNWEVEHTFIESHGDINPLRSSKYVQSSIGLSYQKAKDFLVQGRNVFFVGTPCQIYGLKSYLNKDYQNLLTTDFICHGVPSPKVWELYLNEVVKDKSLIDTISFRDKKKGWKKIFFNVKFKSGEKKFCESSDKNSYLKGFLNNITLRPSCYNCEFKTVQRASDITLADFWGIKHVDANMYDNKGCSLIITHTQRGEDYIKKIRDRVDCIDVDLDNSIQFNSAITKSAQMPKERDAFFKAISNKKSVCATLNSLCSKSLVDKALIFVNKVLRRIRLTLKLRK